MPKSESSTCLQVLHWKHWEGQMADRILRDELWQSERFLDLPTDACRLAFLRMLSEADDFGNLEGGIKRAYRMLSGCTQIKSETATATTLEALIDSDLIRLYKVDGRDLIHIPRTRPHRQYIVRKMPTSPWDVDVKLGKTQRVESRGLAKEQHAHNTNQQLTQNVATTSLRHGSHVAQGVGVGVGVGVGEEQRPVRKRTKPPVETVPRETLIAAGFRPDQADDFIACKIDRKAPLTVRAWEDHKREAMKAGWTPAAAAEKVMAKTWKGFEAKYVADEAKPRTGTSSAFAGAL